MGKEVEALFEDVHVHAELAHVLQQEGRWAEALHHARRVVALAPRGSVLHLWGYAKAATIAADMGRGQLAHRFATVYLALARGASGVEQYTPWVQQAMGIACYQRGRFQEAIAWYRRAVQGFARCGLTEQVAVASSMLAFNLARIGRPQRARACLADRSEFPESRSYLYDSAMTAIHMAEGDHELAVSSGRRALTASGRRSFDFADAAAVALLVSRALRALGARREATAFILSAARFAVRQRWEVLAPLLPNRGQRGGDMAREAAVSRGRGSAHPRDGASLCPGCG
ncbi:tetratricopeptide repeat protein [Symbiobacterium thermophilum]|uniref:MalT-like TPR region domain-containing protein n=1 Tax=Symbiobacterium thermophilum (strain DSM 24528 / JCM 14929 / IAM 14863 / T) TaxID=292459 RepID=Q67QP0_SYMTH|nr:tetratricopeptide repeat protein [Symbiobacterium thermophilum]BAD40003.1 hypothetical protein STH1018 [Symbiobacterium thermophilum IAM 14863]